MKKDIIKLLNHLLEIPLGEQLYAREIRMLFDLLSMEGFKVNVEEFLVNPKR